MQEVTGSNPVFSTKNGIAREGDFFVNRALAVPKAFGKEVTGSNPVFSTKKKIAHEGDFFV